MANYNLSADLAKNLQVYSEFISNRSAVESPRKLDVPLVWDLYMDTTQPVGTALEAYRQEEASLSPIDFSPAEFESGPAAQVTYRSPVTGDLDILGLMNDRLKTQARRYPHPITNEMGEIT